LTKTPNFRHFTTLSRLPLQARLSCDIILMAHILVAFVASSIDISPPTLPIYFNSPFTIGNCPEIKTILSRVDFSISVGVVKAFSEADAF
jgi:hypothetical protein